MSFNYDFDVLKKNIAILKNVNRIPEEMLGFELDLADPEMAESIVHFSRVCQLSRSFLLSKNLKIILEKLPKIKLLILDVDGVLTDGGMYFTESGDQFKKYNTKDGMGIMHFQKKGLKVGIISSGFKSKMVTDRAEMLGIEKCYVGREPKKLILDSWLKEMKLDYSQVAMIGDDINDLELMKLVGLSSCPDDATYAIKLIADFPLSLKGGKGCVREFIENCFGPLT